MNNTKDLQYKFALFIMGILSSVFLLTISVFLDSLYNISLSPPIYMFYIPVILGYIMQRIAINHLALNYKQMIYFEKGILFVLLYLSSCQVIEFLVYRQSSDLLAYNLIIYCSPLLTYTFLSWIYYYIKEFKLKITQLAYIDNDIDVGNNLDETKEDEESLSSINKVIKGISKKVEENIEKK